MGEIIKSLSDARVAARNIPFLETFYAHYPPDDCGIALHPDNEDKNFFADLALPRDHNMIRSIGQYINASPMHFDTRSYIATQGPRRATFEAFWSMIWQEKVSLIVTLTDLTENYGDYTLVKFERYWPHVAELPWKMGSLHVSTDVEELISKWKGKKERLRRRLYRVKDQEKERLVTHLHMEHWPDDGVIDPQSLLDLHEKVQLMQQQGPIVVHCAAGIGRTGTFIALDSLLAQDVYQGGPLDLPKRVEEMRSLRWGTMIAKREQYHLVVDTLELAFKKRGLN